MHAQLGPGHVARIHSRWSGFEATIRFDSGERRKFEYYDDDDDEASVRRSELGRHGSVREDAMNLFVFNSIQEEENFLEHSMPLMVLRPKAVTIDTRNYTYNEDLVWQVIAIGHMHARTHPCTHTRTHVRTHCTNNQKRMTTKTVEAD